MIKQVVLIKRREGMSMEAFIDYFENRHSKIGEQVLHRAKRYMRRYVTPMVNPMTGHAAELDFDVVEEIWWESQADLDATMAEIGEGDTYARIYADEEKLFASHDNRAFTVVEYDSALPGGIFSAAD